MYTSRVHRVVAVRTDEVALLITIEIRLCRIGENSPCNKYVSATRRRSKEAKQVAYTNGNSEPPYSLRHAAVHCTFAHMLKPNLLNEPPCSEPSLIDAWLQNPGVFTELFKLRNNTCVRCALLAALATLLQALAVLRSACILRFKVLPPTVLKQYGWQIVERFIQ